MGNTKSNISNTQNICNRTNRVLFFSKNNKFIFLGPFECYNDKNNEVVKDVDKFEENNLIDTLSILDIDNE